MRAVPHAKVCPADSFGASLAATPRGHAVTTIIREKPMGKDLFDRRTVLAGTTALGAAGMLRGRALAQAAGPATAARPAASLPPRGDFVVRGAHVLSMDESVGDFASGDVHVRDGEIVGIGASVNASGVETKTWATGSKKPPPNIRVPPINTLCAPIALTSVSLSAT